VLSFVPVHFPLTQTEDGGVAGDMEVVSADQAVPVGPVLKAISHHGLEMLPEKGGWRFGVVIDV